MATCSKCEGSATEFDAKGVGFCRFHWQGAIAPGAIVAEKMTRRVGGKLADFWIVGSKVIDQKTWRWKCKSLKGNDFIYIYRPELGRAFQAYKPNLIELRSGMQSIRLHRFAEVFGTRETPAPEIPADGLTFAQYKKQEKL